MRYVVSYDLLNSPAREDYDRIIAAIQQLGGHPLLFSQWIIRRNDTSPQAVFNALHPYIRSGDRMLVTCLDNGTWWGVNLLTDPKTI